MEKDLIILAIYINVENISTSIGQNEIDNIRKGVIESYKDVYEKTGKYVKTFIFPSNETKIECVYPPPNIVGGSSVVENELLKIYKLLLNSENGEAKELIRHIEKKLKLNSIIEKTKETTI